MGDPLHLFEGNMLFRRMERRELGRARAGEAVRPDYVVRYMTLLGRCRYEKVYGGEVDHRESYGQATDAIELLLAQRDRRDERIAELERDLAIAKRPRIQTRTSYEVFTTATRSRRRDVVPARADAQAAARLLVLSRRVCAYENAEGLIAHVGVPRDHDDRGRIFRATHT